MKLSENYSTAICNNRSRQLEADWCAMLHDYLSKIEQIECGDELELILFDSQRVKQSCVGDAVSVNGVSGDENVRYKRRRRRPRLIQHFQLLFCSNFVCEAQWFGEIVRRMKLMRCR